MLKSEVTHDRHKVEGFDLIFHVSDGRITNEIINQNRGEDHELG